MEDSRDPEKQAQNDIQDDVKVTSLLFQEDGHGGKENGQDDQNDPVVHSHYA